MLLLQHIIHYYQNLTIKTIFLRVLLLGVKEFQLFNF